MAAKLGLRLSALEAAESLADFWPPRSGPEQCHELKGDLAGTYSMDLKQPYRLLFSAIDDTGVIPDLAGKEGRERWAGIRSVVLSGVANTHD